PAASLARSRRRSTRTCVGRANRRLRRPSPVLRNGEGEADPLRPRLLGTRRRADLARRSDSRVARAGARRRMDGIAARLAARGVPASGTAQASRRRARALVNPRLRTGGRGEPEGASTCQSWRRTAALVRYGDRDALTVAATAGSAGGGRRRNDSQQSGKSHYGSRSEPDFSRSSVVAALDAGRAAPKLAFVDEAHGLAAVPGEVGRALELAGLASCPGAVVACRRGDRLTAAGQTEVARCAAVLDDEHQGEDQNRSYQHASHAQK